MRPVDFLAGPSNRVGGGHPGLGFQLSHRPRVVPRESRDRVAGLLRDIGQAAAFPKEQGDERAAQAVRPQVTADAGLDRRAARCAGANWPNPHGSTGRRTAER